MGQHQEKCITLQPKTDKKYNLLWPRRRRQQLPATAQNEKGWEKNKRGKKWKSGEGTSKKEPQKMMPASAFSGDGIKLHYNSISHLCVGLCRMERMKRTNGPCRSLLFAKSTLSFCSKFHCRNWPSRAIILLQIHQWFLLLFCFNWTGQSCCTFVFLYKSLSSASAHANCRFIKRQSFLRILASFSVKLNLFGCCLILFLILFFIWITILQEA